MEGFPVIWFPKRLPDDQMTPFKPGDLIVPRGLEYNEDPAIFLGLSWEHTPRIKDGLSEDGWVTYPWVMTPGRSHGRHRYKARVWGTDWTYIQYCELLSRDSGDPPRPSKHWERHGFKFFFPSAVVPWWERFKAFFRRRP